MSVRIYVGNIPFSATELQLKEIFSPFGEVSQVAIVMDRDTNRPRGFAFVEMDDAGAERAIEQLGGTEFGGRTLNVNRATERGSRSGGRGKDERRPSRDRDW